jgi:SAM-dependent methyltransferase
MDESDDFLRPTCISTKLDIYPAQRLILDGLVEQLQAFHGTLLDIGCGNRPYKPLFVSPPSRVTRYIGMDLRDSGYGAPDLRWDGHHIPMDDSSVDCAVATEVLEHCPEPEIVMKEAARVLKPGGFLFFTVPFFWPLHCVPHDEYRYTPFALQRHLTNSGFQQIAMKARGGWDASLAQMIGLWVRRRPMSGWKRRIMSTLAAPLVSYLFKKDKSSNALADQSMIIVISGVATMSEEAH